MGEFCDPRKPTTAFDHATTLVAVRNLSGKSWEMRASVPGVSRRPLRRLPVGELAAAIKALERWKAEARRVGHAILRVVVGYEAGRDGFWIAQALRRHGIEVYVIHPASIAVERRGRRAKTDRIDVDVLLGALLGWLRGGRGAARWRRFPRRRTRTCASRGESASR
jgi:transposase